MARLVFYIFLQTAVAALISFFPNFAIGYIQYKAGTNETIGLWSFDPTPYGGDLLITICVQTFLTYLISGFLISKDLEEQPNWMTRVFGILLEPLLIESEKGAQYYKYVRTYKYTDLKDGIKGFFMGIVRIAVNILLWILVLGVPLTLMMLPFAIFGYRFSGTSCAWGKGVYGSLLAVVQVPVIALLSLATTAELRYSVE